MATTFRRRLCAPLENDIRNLLAIGDATWHTEVHRRDVHACAERIMPWVIRTRRNARNRRRTRPKS